MKYFFYSLFTWWHSQTMGTRLEIFMRGQFVGEDEFGNKYYQSRKGNRRWVTYQGEADASLIPAGWHGWMHHRTDATPEDVKYNKKSWELDHQANLTGTRFAYRPDNSLAQLHPTSGSSRQANTGENSGGYSSWTPS